MKFTPLVLLLALFSLGACSEAQYAAHLAKQVALPTDSPNNVGHFKVGSSYKIKGRRYYPRETYDMTEKGTASWYGPGFHGKLTANGEIFDKNELTAAHRTLQMPSIIRVTNLKNGRSIILRVNDRGPFAHNRVLDVSERASELLGFKNQGTAKVKIEVLKKESMEVAMAAKRGEDTRGYEVAYNQNRVPRQIVQKQMDIAQAPAPQPKPVTQPQRVQPPAPLPKPIMDDPYQVASNTYTAPAPLGAQRLYIQAGSFSAEQNANALAQKLQAYGPSRVSLARVNDRPFYRVRLGPYTDAMQADQALNAVRASNLPDARIITE